MTKYKTKIIDESEKADKEAEDIITLAQDKVGSLSSLNKPKISQAESKFHLTK